MSEAGPSPVGSGPEGDPGMGADPGLPPDSALGFGEFALDGPEIPSAPENATEVLYEVAVSTYYALQDRLASNPVPNEFELEIGVFVEEIQPQVREAVILMREKGYDIGNVLFAGFMPQDHELQVMDFFTELSSDEVAEFNAHGFIIEDDRVGFNPADPTDLGSIKSQWDWFASRLPDKDVPIGPATFGNAVSFREAAANGTLLDFYMPNGELDMIGTKYSRARDPWAEFNLFLSPDAVAATRELTFIDQYHGLKNRINENPTPSDEEFNMGAYEEQLEPQVRAAVMLLRQKGYNTGSSGFWGYDHAEQAMDIATPIDATSKTRLAEHGIDVTEMGVKFKPDNPTDLDSVKKTWDMIADLLPDLGRHADSAENTAADIFRYATTHSQYEDLLENWVWQMGALNGHMDPLTITMINEGRSFGSDVYEPGRKAAARHKEMLAHAAREKVNHAHGKPRA